MLTARQKADYLMQVVKLRKLMILKDNPAFTYQHSNRKQAISRVHSLQDKIVEAAVDNQVYGNSDSVNHQKTVEQTISDALENDRKRVYKSDDNRYINTAVKLNTEKYSEILNNRLNIESVKLEAKIEEEIRKSKYNGLSEAEIKRKLTEEFKDTAKLRTANIIRDALHTNEVNIGFIHALQNGFQYKVWNNGRGKGKVRAWHRARFISSVSIDEPFDIFGSYHAEMMYPGDLNGGAENVANCRCWLSYTNQKPLNYKSKGYSSSTRNNSKSKQNTGSVFSNLKNRVSSLISRSHKFTFNNKNKSQNKKNISSRIKERFSSAIERIKDKIKLSNSNLNKKNSLIQSNNKKPIYEEFEEETNSKKNKWKNKYKYNITFNEKGKVIKKEYDDFSVYWEQQFLSNKQMDIIVNSIDPICKQYISKITLKKAKKNKNGKPIAGSVMPGSNEIILREVPGRHFADYINTIHHEVAHIIDHKIFNKPWGLSSSDEWKEAFILDKKDNIKNENAIKNDYFVSDYARDKYNEYYEKGNLKRLYAEDLADSFKYYINSPSLFEKSFPHRYKILEKYLRSR